MYKMRFRCVDQRGISWPLFSGVERHYCRIMMLTCLFIGKVSANNEKLTSGQLNNSWMVSV